MRLLTSTGRMQKLLISSSGSRNAMVSAPNRDLLFEPSQACRNEGSTGHETAEEKSDGRNQSDDGY